MTGKHSEKIIEQVRQGRFSEKELVALYRNASTRHSEDVMEAIQIKMRDDFPRAANRLFGAKTSQATALLESALAKIGTQTNLSGNKLKNGVKPGGTMLSGEKHVTVYGSYRNESGFGAYLVLEQDTPASELVAIVGEYKVGLDSYTKKEQFTIAHIDVAVDKYHSFVNQLASS